jgi:hypothetical protein
MSRNRFCQHSACGAGCIPGGEDRRRMFSVFLLIPPDTTSIQPRYHTSLSKRTACSQTHHNHRGSANLPRSSPRVEPELCLCLGWGSGGAYLSLDVWERLLC